MFPAAYLCLILFVAITTSTLTTTAAHTTIDCITSDANLLVLYSKLCLSLSTSCPDSIKNVTRSGDWPSQATYMNDVRVLFFCVTNNFSSFFWFHCFQKRFQDVQKNNTHSLFFFSSSHLLIFFSLSLLSLSPCDLFSFSFLSHCDTVTPSSCCSNNVP